jgi:putative ABC transport system substrate-binding protein
MISRRKLLVAVGAGTLTAPLRSFAQQRPALPLVIFLNPASRESKWMKEWIAAFRAGLVEKGLVEDRDLTLELISAEGRFERLPEMVHEAVRRNPNVILTTANDWVIPTHDATRTIPIVAVGMNNPLDLGLAASLARPGGNVTGLISEPGDREAKLIEILHEAIPRVKRFALLADSKYPRFSQVLAQMQAYAKTRGIVLLPALASDAAQIEHSLSAAFNQGAQAVVALRFNRLMFFWPKVLAFMNSRHVPGIFGFQELADEGGLIGYGTNVANLYRRAAGYVARIVHGAKPGDLPIEQPTQFELVLNLKTAKAMGIKFPQSFLVRADRVIE